MNDKFEYQISKKFIKKNSKVIDVGCGGGAFFKQLVDLNIQFTGLDTSDKAIEIAIENNINVINTTVADFSKSNKDFADVVTSFQVCEHISKLKEFVESKIKIAKPGGRIIIAVPSNDSFMSKNINGILNMPLHHVTRWPDEVFHYISKKYNLKLEHVIHEELQKQHYNLFLTNLIQNKIMKFKIIDLSLKRLLLSKISYYASKLLSIFYKPKKNIFGHTVVAIYTKK